MNQPAAETQPDGCRTWVRIIIEKPFGHDLDSARALNDEVNKVFDEAQIFRIDHYLGKETVQNILVFRFANGIFETSGTATTSTTSRSPPPNPSASRAAAPSTRRPAPSATSSRTTSWSSSASSPWSRPSPSKPPPSATKRSKSGAPSPPIHPADTARGQYGPGTVDGKHVVGYRQEDRVNPRSQTETYAALRLEIENWRWAGVPFYIRAGKRLAKRVTEITIQFKQPPMLLFKDAEGRGGEGIKPNVISMRIQPDEGIALRFGAKVPGPGMNISPVNMDFSYAEAFGDPPPTATSASSSTPCSATPPSSPTATASKPPGPS